MMDTNRKVYKRYPRVRKSDWDKLIDATSGLHHSGARHLAQFFKDRKNKSALVDETPLRSQSYAEFIALFDLYNKALRRGGLPYRLRRQGGSVKDFMNYQIRFWRVTE